MALLKNISQSTFDSVVRENIEEFEMTLSEAVEDAIQQFRSQGVDLSNLVTSFVQDPETGDLKYSSSVRGDTTFLCYFIKKNTSLNRVIASALFFGDEKDVLWSRRRVY